MLRVSHERPVAQKPISSLPAFQREIPLAHEDDVKGYRLLLPFLLIPVVMNNSHRTGMEIRIITVKLEGKIELPILRMELHLVQSDSSALPRHTDSMIVVPQRLSGRDVATKPGQYW